MNETDARARLLDAAADFVLEHGPHVSNRTLAAGVGTSHRMLDYHFGGRDGLLEAVLLRLSDRLRDELDIVARGWDRKPSPAEVVAAMTRATSPELTALWLDVLAGAVRGQEPFMSAAARISDAWVAWARSTLGIGVREAEALLAVLEGTGVVAVTRGDGAARRAVKELVRSGPHGGDRVPVDGVQKPSRARRTCA